MAIAGRPPKDPDRRVNRAQLTHDWLEVPDVPFKGKGRPSLPSTMPKETKRWWRTITKMPHCVIWTESDWQFALDTALVHRRFIEGKTGAEAELRRRGEQMGVTESARRQLRIRYVDPEPADEPVPGDEISEFERARREKLLGAN